MSLIESKFIYPNPLNPAGLEIELKDDAEVTLTLLDAQGNTTLKVFENKMLPHGRHEIDFPKIEKSTNYCYYRLIAVSPLGKWEETKRLPQYEAKFGEK
ncbi:MAG: hypothetical protein KGZ58_05185 [Ignavibacteriales bacterium]|nr:hypothetical protein [Ignavibacteriales bacterium]